MHCNNVQVSPSGVKKRVYLSIQQRVQIDSVFGFHFFYNGKCACVQENRYGTHSVSQLRQSPEYAHICNSINRLLVFIINIINLKRIFY